MNMICAFFRIIFFMDVRRRFCTRCIDIRIDSGIACEVNFIIFTDIEGHAFCLCTLISSQINTGICCLIIVIYGKIRLCMVFSDISISNDTILCAFPKYVIRIDRVIIFCLCQFNKMRDRGDMG